MIITNKIFLVTKGVVMKKILSLIICSLCMASCVSQEELLRRQQENEQFIQENIDEIDRKLIEETEPYEVMKTIEEIIVKDKCQCTGRGLRLCTTEIVKFPESIQDNLTNLLPFEPRSDESYNNQYGYRMDKEEYDTFMKSLQGGIFYPIEKDKILFKIAKKMLRNGIANDELFFQCIIDNNYTDECIIYRRNNENFSAIHNTFSPGGGSTTYYKGAPVQVMVVDYKKYFPAVKNDDEYYKVYRLFEMLKSAQSYGCRQGLAWNNFTLYQEFEHLTNAEVQDCLKTTIDNFNAYVKGKKLPACTEKHYNKLKQALQKSEYKEWHYAYVAGRINGYDSYEKRENDFILKYFCMPNKNEMLKLVK